MNNNCIVLLLELLIKIQLKKVWLNDSKFVRYYCVIIIIIIIIIIFQHFSETKVSLAV